MTLATKAYVSRLAGLAVFDPNGDKVGVVRDVVVVLRVGRDAPRVLGLVLEITGRKRVFVAMSRVASLDTTALILTSATLSVRRFSRRTGETLVLEDLLDRKVRKVDGGVEVVVVDASMETGRTREWLLTKVAVRTPGHLGRRRGELQQLAWDEVSGFSLPEAEQGAANLLAVFEKMRPADLANVLHDLSDKRRLEVASALDDERLADVLEELSEEDQVGILGGLENERAADVLEAMAPDDAADLLAELPAADAQILLELMEPGEAADVRRLLSYADDTAGALMTTEPIVLRPDATVAEALARVRAQDISPALASQVYVCRPPTETPTGRYLGIAHIQRLLRESPGTLVGGIADRDIDALAPDCPLSVVTSHLATYNLVAIPIVDSDDRLLGAVTVDDVLDHLLPRNWRDRPPEARRG